MAKYKVLVCDPLPLEHLGLGDDFDVEFAPKATREELMRKISDREVLVVRSRTKVDAELIAAGARLRVIARPGTGLDNIDTSAAASRGIEVFNSPESLVEAVAELIFGMMLSAARNLTEADSSTRKGSWEKDRFVGVELRGRTLGIVGLGRIGRRVGEIARAIGMTIIGYDVVKIDSEVIRALGAKMVDIDSVFSSSDFITLHVPLSPETRHMVDARRLALMKKTAYLVNASRGAVIDEVALASALRSGAIAGAALDVFEKEPPAGEILSSPRLIATPHVGGQTSEAQRLAVSVVGQKIREHFKKRR